jgi:glycosyltransferase involved in cell wall biosynthesis
MRSLIITQFAAFQPEQAVEGAHQRLRTFASAIARISGEVEFLCFVRDEDVAAHADAAALNEAQSAYWGFPVRMTLMAGATRRETFWRHYGAGIFSLSEQPDFYAFASEEHARAIAERLECRPDLVFVHRLKPMGALLRSGRRPRHMFFDLDDIEHKVRIRTALAPPIWPGKLAYCTHVPAIWAAEHRGAALSRTVFVCSETDRRHLRRVGFGANVAVIPNGIRIPAKVPNVTQEQTVLFIGSLGYRPNRDGAERLLTRIWPMIRERVPGARLLIAGRSPEGIPSFRNPPPGVTFTGFVASLDHLYAQSRIVVCPLTVGGGTRIKLLEAASYARPMVSTRIGAEGLAFIEDEEILLRDDDRSFADACARLLEDDALCAALGGSARAKVAAIYDVERIRDKIASQMAGQMAQPPNLPAR